jgi:hypothetical protein
LIAIDFYLHSLHIPEQKIIEARSHISQSERGYQ